MPGKGVLCISPPLALGVAARGGIGREPKAWHQDKDQVWWVCRIGARARRIGRGAAWQRARGRSGWRVAGGRAPAGGAAPHAD